MEKFIFKDEEDNMSALIEATQNMGSLSNSGETESTILADNGEVINLGTEATHTKD